MKKTIKSQAQSSVRQSGVQPAALIFAGYGLNCEEETAHAFQLAGASTTIIHINDLIESPEKLKQFQIVAIPGGFSYGDDTGSGNAYANKLRNTLWEQLSQFVQRDTLTIGICNGFQILVNLGLVPAHDGSYGERSAALMKNSGGLYLDRWVDLVVANQSPWLRGLTEFSLPIAHGEGKFYVEPEVLVQLKKNNQIALRYTYGEVCQYQDYPANPNGALDDIAGITDPSGRVLGLMPHPERGMFFTQQPHWTLLKERNLRSDKPNPEYAAGFHLFQNAVGYFG